MTKILALMMLLTASSCTFVTFKYQEAHSRARSITVPYAVVRTAMSFTSDQTLDISDLGGITSEIDMKELIKSFRKDGHKFRLVMTQSDGTTMQASAVNKTVQVRVDDPRAEEEITLNLPIDLLESISHDSGRLSRKHFHRAFRKFRGTLIEVRSPEEHIQVLIR